MFFSFTKIQNSYINNNLIAILSRRIKLLATKLVENSGKNAFHLNILRRISISETLATWSGILSSRTRILYIKQWSIIVILERMFFLLKILCREFIKEEAETLSRILITGLLLGNLSPPVALIYTPKELMQFVQPCYLTPVEYRHTWMIH